MRHLKFLRKWNFELWIFHLKFFHHRVYISQKQHRWDREWNFSVPGLLASILLRSFGCASRKPHPILGYHAHIIGKSVFHIPPARSIIFSSDSRRRGRASPDLPSSIALGRGVSYYIGVILLSSVSLLSEICFSLVIFWLWVIGWN